MNKGTSTFDKWMKNKDIAESFKREYHDLILSELIIAIMEDDKKSVRSLAKAVDISPTIIQNLRSGKQIDIKMSNFLNIVNACGYNLVLEKEDKRIPLNPNN